jgi:hypothetical protein
MKAVLGKDLSGKKFLGDADVLGARQWRHEVKIFDAQSHEMCVVRHN